MLQKRILEQEVLTKTVKVGDLILQNRIIA
jgi:hypothetical protein